MTRTRWSLCLFLLLVWASAVAAQTADSYEVKYYPAGGPAPLAQTDTFLASAVLCNQAPPTTTLTVNPTRVVWDDPANAGKACIYVTSPPATMRTLPAGSYEAVVSAINAVGRWESARLPFTRQVAPAALAGVKVIQ